MKNHNMRKPSVIQMRILATLMTLVAILMLSGSLTAMEHGASSGTMHPIMNPKMYSKSMICPNCGMMINMWARTRHSFEVDGHSHETCSIRCMADLSGKAGQSPQNVHVAVYHDPDTMIAADKAVYVIGSKAKGTMTMKSKIAFASKEEAENFAKTSGGQVMSFADTIKMASMEVGKTRSMIQAMRMKKGKIQTPPESASCGNCGMMPAKFPQHRAQISTKDGKHVHFCSTKCLVKFLDEPTEKVSSTWVTVFPDGDYDFANGLYYVVGSKTMGPMGPSALPFRNKADAHSHVAKEGGHIVAWSDLNMEEIMGSGGHSMNMGHGQGSHQ